MDGIFGPATEARVREFQRANGLKIDGLVGDRTNAQLFEVTTVVVPLFFMPSLSLTPPTFGVGPSGLQATTFDPASLR